MFTNTAELHIPHGQGQEVRRDLLIHAEIIMPVGRLHSGVGRAHQRHGALGYVYVRLVRETNAGGVLARNPRTRQDGLALGEEEGVVAFDPQQCAGLRRTLVVDADLSAFTAHWKTEGLSDEALGWTQFKVHGLAVHAHRLDGQVGAIEDDALGVFGCLDVVRRGRRDDAGVKIDGGVPVQVGDNRLIGSAVAVVVGGSFHVKNGLGFGRIGRGFVAAAGQNGCQGEDASNKEG